MKETYVLHHEKLIVYQKSIKFLALSECINDSVKRGRTNLKDQLGRAALSIPLNISEGYGKYSRKDRKT